MKQVLAFFFVLLALAACTGTSTDNKEQSKPILDKNMPGYRPWMEHIRENTRLTRYEDSIKTVYPNFEGNLVVQKNISKDFGEKLAAEPGILYGSTFHLASMFEKDGKTCVSFICNEAGVNVWCLDYNEADAAKLDKDKAYEITDYVIDHFEANDDEVGSSFLFLGNIYVKSLTVEEI